MGGGAPHRGGSGGHPGRGARRRKTRRLVGANSPASAATASSRAGSPQPQRCRLEQPDGDQDGEHLGHHRRGPAPRPDAGDPHAIQATPSATMASSTMNAIAFEVVQASPDTESTTLSMTATQQARPPRRPGRGRREQHGRLPKGADGHLPADDCVPGTPSAERIPIVSIPPGTVNLSNVRALLIINPRATSMTGRDAGLVVRALGSRLELDTRQTQYRGHAGELAAASAADGYDLVVTFSGDGTVNEVVNGLMRIRRADGAPRPRAHPWRRRQRVRAHPRAAARGRRGGAAHSRRGRRPASGARSGSAWPATATSRSAPDSVLTPRSSLTWSGSGRAAGARPWRPTCGRWCAGTTAPTAAVPRSPCAFPASRR